MQRAQPSPVGRRRAPEALGDARKRELYNSTHSPGLHQDAMVIVKKDLILFGKLLFSETFHFFKAIIWGAHKFFLNLTLPQR